MSAIALRMLQALCIIATLASIVATAVTTNENIEAEGTTVSRRQMDQPSSLLVASLLPTPEVESSSMTRATLTSILSEKPTDPLTAKLSAEPTSVPSLETVPSLLSTADSVGPLIPSPIDDASKPSYEPTTSPSMQPTLEASHKPTILPSMQPTPEPSYEPTILPSMQPTPEPSYVPTSEPSYVPTLVLIYPPIGFSGDHSVILFPTSRRSPTRSPTRNPSN